jgi:hypothetical protein
MTVAKGGDSTEWTMHIEELVKTLHSTADQVFRAVQENWESTIGYKSQPVNVDAEPQGGSGDLDQFPRWVGVQAGGERIIGLLDFIRDYLSCRTRVAVTVPITSLVDIATRISSIKPLPLGKEKFDSGQMNPAIGREERDELWAIFPDIQVASMRMHIVLLQRLQMNYIPLAPETLDQVLRIFQSSYRLPLMRTTVFFLVKDILCLCGPTLPRHTVESLSLIIKCCCHDLLGAAGHLKKPKPQSSSASQNSQKSKTISQNADAFLPSKVQDDVVSVSLSAEHLRAAEALLTTLFNHVPQQHIPSSLRSQMLKTAILCRNRDAQVASILHPARDRSGRTPQAILPYLTQQFPQDESVEILRFNFRPVFTGLSSDFLETDDAMAMEEDDEHQTDSKTNGFSFGQGFDTQFPSSFAAPVPTAQFKASSPIPVRNLEPIHTPFLVHSTETKVQSEIEPTAVEPSANSLKRKNEDATAEISFSKRVEIDITRPAISGHSDTTAFTNVTTTTTRQIERAQGHEVESDDDDDDDESVHLNMELDSDDGDDEEDE